MGAAPPLLPAKAEVTKICAVMVTFNPIPTLEQNIRALLPEVDRLIVVDNGSAPASYASTQMIAAACGCEVLRNEANLGIAGGINAGIRYALSTGDYGWIATFDHDSLVSPGFRDIMLHAWRCCPFREQVALIGPYHVLFPEDPLARLLKGPATPPYAEKPVMLQSGSLISTACLGRVGLMDESFFIDYVDVDFCLRLRRHCLRIIEASNAILVHEVGSPTSHSILKRTCVVYNHSPVRRYYAARNRPRVYCRYFLSDPRWIAHDAWSWFKEIVKLLLFERNRKTKLGCMALGVWDAFRCRSGPYTGGIAIIRSDTEPNSKV